MRHALLFLIAGSLLGESPDELVAQLLSIKRIYVDPLNGGEAAQQMRDLIIASLQSSKLVIVTENQDRADAFLRGAAEDLVFTDAFSSSESVNMRVGGAGSEASSAGIRIPGNGSTSNSSRSSRSLNLGVGEHESTNIRERKHEAMATVRLVNKDGDVIWSTTQESTGAKFRGASADVADKITRQLTGEIERLRRKEVQR